MPPSPESHVANLQLYPSSRSSVEWAEVEPAVRNVSFFSASVENERVLAALKNLVEKGLDMGWSMGEFVYQAELVLDSMRADVPGDADSTYQDGLDLVADYNRLRLIFRTQGELASGYAQFCEAYSDYDLYQWPCWRFMRMDGAKEDQKRPDHVEHEYDVRLKTDIQYWLDRNRFDIGGFGNPYGPWGFNSWMYTEPVDRKEAIALGFIGKNERLRPPPELAEWNLPNALQQMGTASTNKLDMDAVERVIRECEAEGFVVAYDEEQKALQVMPSPRTPLGDLSDAAFELMMEEDIWERVDRMMAEEEAAALTQ